MQHRLLWFYVAPSSRAFVGNFLEDVVDGGQDASRWRLGRVLIPSFTIDELMATTATRLLECLGAEIGDVFDRIVPTRQNWERYGVAVGAPAIVRPQLDYEWSGGPHLIDLHIENTANLEPAGDATVAVRRWIAFRLFLKHRELLNPTPFDRPSQMLSELYPGIQVTADVQVSVRPILAELRCTTLNENRIPGFCGPDIWYDCSVVDEWIR